MFNKLMRLLVVAVLVFGSMAAFTALPTVNSGLAQTATPETDPCEDDVITQLAGFDREFGPDETAVSMPPLDTVEDCNAPVAFFRTVVLSEEDPGPLGGFFPEGKIGFNVDSGGFKLNLTKGEAVIYVCQDVEDGPCPSEAVGPGEYDVLEGDSVFLQAPEGDALEFTIAFGAAEQVSGSGARAMLAHGGSHASVGGSTTRKGAISPMGCDSGGCY